ncbi:hypothetical protein Tco_0091415 [Tanacetum coccineum]
MFNNVLKRMKREQAANLAVQKEQEEQAAQSFTPYWNFPMIDDDDEEYTIQYKEYLEKSSKAITPDLPTEDALSMGDEHLSTIPEKESDESPSSFPIPIEDCDSFLEKSDTSLSYSDNSLPEFETFRYHTEETSNGGTTTHADNSLPKYDLFHFKIEPD